MATYYKYAERSAEDYVDWGAIGKTMSDTLLKEQENRDKMKADIDKASREFGETLMNSPQGEHRGMNQWALDYANNAQEFQLMQLRNLKAGKLSLKDYLVSRENLKQGTSDAFDVMKKYNDKYGEFMERQKNGENAGLETFLLGEVEGFGNLTSSSLYINPANGQVSAGMRVPRDPSKPYDPQTNPYTAKMSNNPSDFRTLNSLNFALSAQIDKYDAAGAVEGIIDSFATDYQILTRGSRGKLTTVNDVRQMGEDGKLFTDALEKKIVANFDTNPFQTLSTIQDYLVYGPDGEKIELTRDPAEVNEHTLLLKANAEQPDGGMPQADFTSETGKKILEYMKEKMGEQVLAGLNRKVTGTAGFAPQRPSESTRNKNRTDKSNLNLLGDLYYGDKAEIQTALKNLRGTKTVHGPIDKITRTDTGVSITAGNKTIPFEFADLNATEFVESISSEFGINFSDAVKGANIQGGKPLTQKIGALDATVTTAPTTEAASIQAFNQLAQDMSNQGYDFATKLGYDVKTVEDNKGKIKGYKLTKGENSRVVKESSKAIIDYIKTDILNDEILDFYNRGIIPSESGGSGSMAGY
jgi:hypothetical protein